MGEQQMELRFSWVLKKFSSLQDEKCYSRPFSVSGINWCLAAHRKGDNNNGHLYLFLEFADPDSLPPGWSRDVKFSLTLVTKAFGKSNIVMEENHLCFKNFCSQDDVSHYSPPFKVGCDWRLVAIPKRDKDGGYLSMYIDLAPGTLPPGWRRDVEFSLTLVKQGLPILNKTTGQGCFYAENSSWGFEEFLPLSKVWGYLDDCRLTIIAELDVCPEEPVNFFEPSLRFNQSDDASVSRSQMGQVSCQVEQKTENPSNQDSDDALQEIQPVKKTTNVNGFEVLSSQVESVKLILERHPDIAVEFNAENQLLRNVCMNFLLSLVETVCQSIEKLSNEDLVEADVALTYLKDAGFKVEWLEKKLDQLKEKKKEEEELGLAQLQEIEETLLKLKQRCSELQTLAEEEKAGLSAIRTALSFDDLV